LKNCFRLNRNLQLNVCQTISLRADDVASARNQQSQSRNKLLRHFGAYINIDGIALICGFTASIESGCVDPPSESKKSYKEPVAKADDDFHARQDSLFRTETEMHGS
jgi:hypothetical protein